MTEKNETTTETQELSDDVLSLVGGGFNPQPDPPGDRATQSSMMLIGLLLPAI
jgi:hypothetical protein